MSWLGLVTKGPSTLCDLQKLLVGPTSSDNLISLTHLSVYSTKVVAFTWYDSLVSCKVLLLIASRERAFTRQARSHNEANEAVASPKISKKNLPQMKNS